ncbi:trihelix transcription factor ASR3-like [Impatiens glandulifera]|uniref:trihelix transcription factor ASR3-like n=1 Tax=Impatiens glandulifera TaxID=253017 RepID=UPI001FB086FA|nr:trihelix transcription factor ASR3-like [Impatiens glandulifera]
MENQGDILIHGPASRRTRSQVAPNWTVQDSLILVNEVGAVELECKNAFASFQKWTIVAQNCNSLMANRSLDQVRRRWDSILGDYNKIKKYQEEKSMSYWSMIEEKRKEFRLPDSFDLELFKEMSRVLPIIENTVGADLVTDPDPELVVDDDVIVQSGYKKQRQPPQQHLRQISNQKFGTSQKRSTNKRVNLPPPSPPPSPPSPPEEPSDDQFDPNSVEEIEQLLVEKLRENSEVINAIVEGSGCNQLGDIELADPKNMDADEIDVTRLNGDEVIARLGNLSETLDKLHDLILACRR